MIIENKKGILDMDPGASLEIEKTNPLFNEQGSASLPFSIKNTPHNNYILGFPDRYERKEVFEDKQPVNIRSGILNENGTLELLETFEKIEGVIYLYESSFYSKAKETKLVQVFDGIERWFSPKTTPREDRISHILDILETMIFKNPDLSGDFTVFPVATECELYSRTLEGMVGGKAVSKDIINEVYIHYEPNKEPQSRLKGKYPYSYEDSEGNQINIPKGYGVSPFLRLKYVLRKIFEHFGLTLLPNIFDDKYAAVTVVNNTMDAIMNGCFIESQLVPDCTVNDFLDIIREGFCADFKINGAKKTAEIIIFNDVLDAVPDMDLTEFLINVPPKLQINKPKQVKLTVSKSLPYAGTATDTFEEFKKKYPDYKDFAPLLGSEGIFPYHTQNSIWKLSEPQAGWLWSSYKSDRISSMNFDYDTTDDIPREEHKVPFEAPASISLTATDHFSYITAIIGNKRNLNSYVILDGKAQSEDSVECPPMLLLEAKYSFCRIGVMSHGNLDNYHPPVGVPYVSLNLWGILGLFNKFWKRYDKLSRVSFNPITFRAKLPVHILANFTFERLKIINGQPLFPVSIKYKMTEDDYIDTEMNFKTVKIYGKDEPSEEIPQTELDFFIGRWKYVPGSSFPDTFQCQFELKENYTGWVYLKNDKKEFYSDFMKITIHEVSSPETTFKQLVLEGPWGNIALDIRKQNTTPEKSYILTWVDEYASAKMIVDEN